MMALDWRGRYHSKKSAVNLVQPGCSLSELRAVPPFRRVPSRELNKKKQQKRIDVTKPRGNLERRNETHEKLLFFLLARRKSPKTRDCL